MRLASLACVLVVVWGLPSWCNAENPQQKQLKQAWTEAGRQLTLATQDMAVELWKILLDSGDVTLFHTNSHHEFDDTLKFDLRLESVVLPMLRMHQGTAKATTKEYLELVRGDKNSTGFTPSRRPHYPCLLPDSYCCQGRYSLSDTMDEGTRPSRPVSCAPAHCACR